MYWFLILLQIASASNDNIIKLVHCFKYYGNKKKMELFKWVVSSGLNNIKLGEEYNSGQGKDCLSRERYWYCKQPKIFRHALFIYTRITPYFDWTILMLTLVGTKKNQINITAETWTGPIWLNYLELMWTFTNYLKKYES